MKVTLIEQYGSWESVKRAALQTIRKKPIKGKQIKESWKKQMLLAEHSPIRLLAFSFLIEDLECFAQTHLVRHHVGVEKFVSTLRSDIAELKDTKITRETLNDMEFYVNAQALMTISRKRLCMKASKETRALWNEVVRVVSETHHVFKDVCVPECVYRGFCTEFKSCGKTLNKDSFDLCLENYRKVEKD